RATASTPYERPASPAAVTASSPITPKACADSPSPPSVAAPQRPLPHVGRAGVVLLAWPSAGDDSGAQCRLPRWSRVFLRRRRARPTTNTFPRDFIPFSVSLTRTRSWVGFVGAVSLP